jgi:hypothetical protein
LKRPLPASNVTSADSTDVDEEDNGELPASGLVAPWEVLRGLADVAVEQASKENGDESQPQSRTRTPDGESRRARPTKRRKVQHKPHRYHDVVTKNIISEAEARSLFQIFYHGCSTFLPVFDGNVDTYDALHVRSPFAVNCICMVAAKVRDGGGESWNHLSRLVLIGKLYRSAERSIPKVSRRSADYLFSFTFFPSDSSGSRSGYGSRFRLV